MNKIILNTLLFAVLALAIASCKKDENRIVLEGGTAPVLTASSTAALTLLKDKMSSQAITFFWTNPDYKFNTGVSSQNVAYVLQVDMPGGNFASSKLQEMVIQSSLSAPLTVKQFNGFLSQMELEAGKQHTVEVRVKSSLANGIAAPLYSNALTLKATPYLDFAVEPPGTEAGNYDDGNLWAIGNAFYSDYGKSSWSNPMVPPYDGSVANDPLSQKFKKIDKLHYELIVEMPGGGGYKLIQTQGVWGTQYHALDGGTWASGSFEKKDSDPQFPGVPEAGRYKIQMNFQTGKYTVTKQ